MTDAACAEAVLGQVLTAKCICVPGSGTADCLIGNVCFKSTDTEPIYTCASQSVAGGNETQDIDKNKFCTDGKESNAKVSLITGAGYCYKDGQFAPDCKKDPTNQILKEDCACVKKEDASVCAANSVCFEPEVARLENTCANKFVTGPNGTTDEHINYYCKENKESDPKVSLITGVGYCYASGDFVLDCPTEVLGQILTKECSCPSKDQTAACAKDSVCFKSEDAEPIYTCATEKIQGPIATTKEHEGKICQNNEELESKLSLITGAGFCDAAGVFTPLCGESVQNKVLETGCLCVETGTAETPACAAESVCFKSEDAEPIYTCASQSVAGGNETQDEHKGSFCTDGKQTDAKVSLITGAGYCYKDGQFAPDCKKDPTNQILKEDCACVKKEDASVCAANSVCFEPEVARLGNTCARESVENGKATVAEDNGKFCKENKEDKPQISLVTGAGFCYENGSFTPLCAHDSDDEILTAGCLCAAEGAADAKVCEAKSVCFKIAGEATTYKCASTFVTGPQATTVDDANKYCQSAGDLAKNVTLITGAGYCHDNGVFALPCTKIGKEIEAGAFCTCGADEYCSGGDACFKVGKEHHCYAKVDESGVAGERNYAPVGTNGTPTIMKYGQYYDSDGKKIVDTCLSEFTPVSTKCNCVNFEVKAKAAGVVNCKDGEFCNMMEETGCVPIAEINQKVVDKMKLCGNGLCKIGEYCTNLSAGKKAADAGSFCTEEVAVGAATADEYGFCDVEGKEGVCFGKDTKCIADQGCECVVAGENVESYGVCFGSKEKTCNLGQTWNGTDCKDPEEPKEEDVFEGLVLTQGPIKCGKTTTISKTGIQYCYKDQIYPQCLFSAKTAEKCICVLGANEDEKLIVTLLNKGSVCTGNNGVLCPSGYKYTDDKKNNCKKSSSSLSVGAIVGIVVAVVVVIGVIVGVVVGMNKKKSKVETHKDIDEPDVAQAIQE